MASGAQGAKKRLHLILEAELFLLEALFFLFLVGGKPALPRELAKAPVSGTVLLEKTAVLRILKGELLTPLVD
jgi:hypothetical protein